MNNWGNDTDMSPWEIVWNEGGYYEINQTLITRQTSISFKFSNIGWSHVELDSEGNDIENRKHNLIDSVTPYEFTVVQWK